MTIAEYFIVFAVMDIFILMFYTFYSCIPYHAQLITITQVITIIKKNDEFYCILLTVILINLAINITRYAKPIFAFAKRNTFFKFDICIIDIL